MANTNMALQKLRGKKANANRWEALKMLGWEKDIAIIEMLFKVQNPLFFSKRTPQQAIEEIKGKIGHERS